MPLTKNQQSAVDHSGGHLQIIACAGSGKTEVVARRVARLLEREGPAGLRPAHIVAFTFTEKAAAELKDRIALRVREAVGELPGLAELYVGTIHAYCLELLKQHVPKYLKFSVLSEVQRALLVDRNSKQSGLTESRALSDVPLQRYKDTSVYCRAVDVLREDACDVEKLSGCSVARNAASYRELLNSKAVLDYSEILHVAVRLLESDPEFRESMRGAIRHLIVDEYQDVNPIQERLVRALVGLGSTLCVVGDDDQTIYQWRGSDVFQIVSFDKRYAGSTRISLEENFRSSEGIVATARDFIAANAVRLQKAMIPTGAQTYEPGDICARSFDDPGEEAQFVADTIRQLRGMAFRDGDTNRGLSWSDCAILLRSVKGSAAPILDALRRSGIPFVVVGMSDLFATAEVQAARASFYYLASTNGVSSAMVRQAWLDAGLGLSPGTVEDAICFLDETRDSLNEGHEGRWGLYSIQRTFLTLLERLGLREESVIAGRGEIVFYNLGKFSQAISDFEQIHFHSAPPAKYETFSNFLQYQAESYYAEGWQDNQYASPDAVRVMTVHQSKGLQWPVVFLPALARNRFPAAKVGGRNVWHLIPQDAVPNAARYAGGIEDERRLFYVAMTRSQKFLFASWAPVPGNRRYQVASEFYNSILASRWVKRSPSDLSGRLRAEPRPRNSVSNVVLTFSDLKYFFECPYQFKLRVLYGFNAPLHEALGYGKSLHDCLAEIHARALRGDVPSVGEAETLVATHLHVPFAYPALRRTLEAAAQRVTREYLLTRKEDLTRLEYAEKQVELDLGEGVTVVGRIDLVRRLDTGEVSIVDMKASDMAQPERTTEQQLHIYAVGYEQLTGKRAEYVEIYELDTQTRKARTVDDGFVDEVKSQIKAAAVALKLNQLPARPAVARCKSCDVCQICQSAARV
jgi:DNA helicase-2/ATP-dependent DNA helicase PcrA